MKYRLTSLSRLLPGKLIFTVIDVLRAVVPSYFAYNYFAYITHGNDSVQKRYKTKKNEHHTCAVTV